jgi:hypothetical protein
MAKKLMTVYWCAKNDVWGRKPCRHAQCKKLGKTEQREASRS